MFVKPLLFFVFLILGLNFNVNSQGNSFPIDSTTWYYSVEDFSGPTPIWTNSDYTIFGDTIINNYSYQRVNTSYFSTEYIYRVDSAGRVWIRYLNPGLFLCTDTNELLAYDFSLNVNDTIFMHNCYGDSFLCKVNVIDSIATNLGKRKQLKFGNQLGLTCLTSDTLTWMEGIGSSNDLFYNLNFYSLGMICEQHFYFGAIVTYGHLVYITKTNELVMNHSIYIDDNYTIHSHEKLEKLYIYDLLGDCVFNCHPNEFNYSIDKSKLNPGLYIIIIYLEGKNNVVKLKIVIY